MRAPRGNRIDRAVASIGAPSSAASAPAHSVVAFDPVHLDGKAAREVGIPFVDVKAVRR